MFEEAKAFLAKAPPETLLLWLKNAAEHQHVVEENLGIPSNWWRISQLFEEAAYKIKVLRPPKKPFQPHPCG